MSCSTCAAEPFTFTPDGPLCKDCFAASDIGLLPEERDEGTPQPATATQRPSAREVSQRCAEQEPTDAGNAQRFAIRSVEHVHAVVGEKNGWTIWDAKRHAPDDAEATKATRLALKATEAIKHECDVLRSQGAGDDAVKARFSHYLRSQSRPRIEAMLKLARPALAIDPERLDADPDLLNTPSGTVHLPTRELRPHNPRDLISRCTSADYDPTAEAPIFTRHLERILPDPATRAYFQRVAGYALTGHTTEQKFFVGFGSGATGKSTTARALSHALGDYATSAAAETFMQSRRGGGETRSDLVRLRGFRFVTLSEATDGLRFDERLIKEITGGEKLTQRGLYSSEVSFTPSLKLFISCNAVPSFDGADSAMRRRLRVIPFEVEIPEADQDGDLAAKLADEAPGILAWAIEGAREWYEQGLGNCPAVEAASAASSQAADPVGQFLEDECVRDPDAFIPAADVAEAYGRWAEAYRQPELGATRLGNALSKHGLQTGREYVNGKRVRVRLGVRFASERSNGTARDGFSRESYVGGDLRSPGKTRPGPSQPLEQATSGEAEKPATDDQEAEFERIAVKFGEAS